MLVGGKPGAGAGYFYEPTVLTGLPHDAPVVSEEFFGPVALLFPFEGDDEAIRLANATEYGLGAAVWSQDLAARPSGRRPDRSRCRLRQRLRALRSPRALWRREEFRLRA